MTLLQEQLPRPQQTKYTEVRIEMHMIPFPKCKQNTIGSYSFLSNKVHFYSTSLCVFLNYFTEHSSHFSWSKELSWIGGYQLKAKAYCH